MIAAAANQLGCAVRAALLALFALAVALLAAASILSWRLAQGPLDAAWLARRIEAAANPPGQPARLSIARAQLQWNGFANGPGHGLDLRLDDAAITGPDGARAAAAHRIDLTVSVPRLLLGQIVPRALAAAGIDLSLIRDPAGNVVLDGGGLPVQSDSSGPTLPATLSETLAELARPARIPGTRPQRPDLQHLEELQSVQLTDTVLHLHDAALGSAIEIDLSSVDLRRQRRGGVLGSANAAITLGAARTTATLQADLAANGGTRLQLTFTPVNAATVQSADPALATPDGLDAAIAGNATLQLDAALHPAAASLSLQSGSGQLRLAGAAIGFDNLNLDAAATWDRPAWTIPQHLAISRARAVVQAPGGAWPTTITAAAAVSRGAGGYTGTVEGTVDHLAFADIPRLWPKPLGGHVRPWLVANVTAGVARDGALKASFEARPDLSAITLTAIDATAKGQDVTVWWLRPAPPVEAAQATLTFRDPELLDILVSSARQGPVALSNGLIHFTGMADKDQFMALGADLSGNVADIFALLKNPALQLLSKSPVAIRNPSGALAGHLTVNLPMRDVVPFEEVRIGTSAKITDLHLGGLVVGRDLDHATAQLDAGSDGLHTTGRGLVAGIPSDLALDMDFRPGPPGQIVQKASATARATRPQLAAAGFDPGSLMPAGTALLTAQYAQRRDGTADLTAAADLHDATLAVAGWTKPPDAAAELHAHLLIRRDHLAAIDTLGATGPGLFVSGHADTPADAPILVTLDRLSLGRTEAHGQIQLPTPTGAPARVTLSGPVLDLAPALKSSSAQSAKSGTPWIADLQFDHLLLTAPTAPASPASPPTPKTTAAPSPSSTSPPPPPSSCAPPSAPTATPAASPSAPTMAAACSAPPASSASSAAATSPSTPPSTTPSPARPSPAPPN